MKQSDAQHIVIVGGQLIGLSAAVAILDAYEKSADPTTCRLTILDRLPQSAVNVPDRFMPPTHRVIAVSEDNIRWLSELGIWQNIPAHAYQSYIGMDVWDGLTNRSLHFAAQDSKLNRLGVMLDTQYLLHALQETLREKYSSTAQFLQDEVSDISCDESGCKLKLASGHFIQADFLLAADGANSTVVQALDLQYRTFDYETTAITATLRTEEPHGNVARQVFWPEGPIGILPLSDSHHVSVVWSVKNAASRRIKKMDDVAFSQYLANRLSNKLGAMSLVTSRQAFPLKSKIMKQISGPGFAVLGDAAHVIHPLAGLGANLGFRDVRALSLLMARSLQAPFAVLSTSQLDVMRRADTTLTHYLTRGFHELFTRDAGLFALTRAVGLDAVEKTTMFKKLAQTLAVRS